MSQRLPWIAVGWDQSIKHGAAVALAPSGEVLDVLCLAKLAGDAKRFPRGRRFRIPNKLAAGKMDKAVRAQAVQLWTEVWLRRVLRALDELADEVFIGLEDYAFAADKGAHQIGAVGGALRRLIVTGGQQRHLRLVEPSTLKTFARAPYRGTKDEVEIAAVSKWGLDDLPVRDGEGDVVDAYVLARMTRVEVLLRRGELDMRDLAEEERRYFLRVTKTYPVNVLDRPWLDAESVALWRVGHDDQ